MKPLDSIAIRVDTSAPTTGNVAPILHQIRHALRTLLEDGTPTAVDLRSLPLAPGELEQIEQALGHGETTVTLEALGRSEIRETQYPGVWWIEHTNSDGQVTSLFIEITRVPDIVLSQTEDIESGLDTLTSVLASPEPNDNSGG